MYLLLLDFVEMGLLVTVWTRLDFRCSLGRSAGSFPEQRPVIEPRCGLVLSHFMCFPSIPASPCHFSPTFLPYNVFVYKRPNGDESCPAAIWRSAVLFSGKGKNEIDGRVVQSAIVANLRCRWILICNLITFQWVFLCMFPIRFSRRIIWNTTIHKQWKTLEQEKLKSWVSFNQLSNHVEEWKLGAAWYQDCTLNAWIKNKRWWIVENILTILRSN